MGATHPRRVGKPLCVKLRGHLAFLTVVLALVLSDVAQRLVIAPIVWLFPSRRTPVLTRWKKLMAAAVLRPIGSIGGAKIAALPRIPGGPGVLVLMNHQSLLDIPLVVSVLQDTYPQIITRQRYGSWIPLISHMIRLYQHPVVEPRASPARTRDMLAQIEETAARTAVPMTVFPEGTRTRNGEIGRFKTAALKAILGVRKWSVYLVVADGFWEHAKLKDFLRGMSEIDGRVRVMGPFAWDDPAADRGDFIDSLRDRMVDCMVAMRAGRAA